MIIHISGAPGSGKTTLGNIIKKKFKNVKVIDIDDVITKFMILKEKNSKTLNEFKKDYAQECQKYLDKIITNTINNTKAKNIVFVGLNYPDPEIEFKNRTIHLKPYVLDVRADHKFFIDIDPIIIAKRFFLRSIERGIKDIDNLFNDAMDNNKQKFIIDIGEVIRDSNEWKEMFKKINIKC